MALERFLCILMHHFTAREYLKSEAVCANMYLTNLNHSSAFLETSVLTVETLVTSHLKILGTESFVNGDVIVQGGDSTFMVSRLIVRGKFV